MEYKMIKNKEILNYKNVIKKENGFLEKILYTF